MRIRTKLLGSVVILLFVAASAAWVYWRYWGSAPPASQHGLVEQQIARTIVTVDYVRPAARGREPLGDVVAWGQLWSPSDARPALIRFSTDVQVNGQPLKKGSYAVWTQPRQDAWTVIFSRAVNTDHPAYVEGQDALKLTASPRLAAYMDTLAFYFPVVDGRAAELVLHWGRMALPLQITVP